MQYSKSKQERNVGGLPWERKISIEGIYSPIPANFIKEFRGIEQQPLRGAISLWNLILGKRGKIWGKELGIWGMDGNFLMNPISDYPVWGVCQNGLLRKRAVARIPVLYVWGVRQNGFLRKNGEGKLGAPPMNLCLRYTDWVI